MTAEAEPNAASVAVINSDRVLLIQRAFEPLKGLWTLPGGRREPGESIEGTAVREVWEEVRLRVSALRPVMAFGVVGTYRLQVFATDEFDGTVSPNGEISDYRWLSPGAAAELPTTPRLDEVLDGAFALVRGR